MDAWTQYQQEQWRNRTNLKRLRDKNIRHELLKLGIKNPSPDDLAALRHMMYDPGPAGCWASFMAKDGKLLWLVKPSKYLTLEQSKATWPEIFGGNNHVLP